MGVQGGYPDHVKTLRELDGLLRVVAPVIESLRKSICVFTPPPAVVPNPPVAMAVAVAAPAPAVATTTARPPVRAAARASTNKRAAHTFQELLDDDFLASLDCLDAEPSAKKAKL